MPDSSDFYSLKNGNLLATHSQKTAKLYYSRLFPHDLHPRCAYSSPGIDLPIQETISLNPSERILCDTHLKFFIPSNYYGQLVSRSSTAKLEIYIQVGVIDNDCAADFALLNLPKGKSLGRSKPATNSSNEQAH